MTGLGLGYEGGRVIHLIWGGSAGDPSSSEGHGAMMVANERQPYLMKVAS